MKTSTLLIVLFIFLGGVYGCSSTQKTATDPNIGTIGIEIQVVTGTDSLARTPDGKVIGKIDQYGNIYDLAGHRIGKRKLTDKELIEQAGY